MKKSFLILLYILFPWLLHAQDIPAKPIPARFVNDYVHILSADQNADLEYKLKTFEDSTSNQVVVAIVSTTKEYEPADYAFALGRKWGVGTKDFNNGIVILVAKDDHKVFIATGYGLEGALPDATCKEIVENDIIPYFKDNDYYKGISNGIHDIIAATKGEYKSKPKSSGKTTNWVFLVLFFLSLFCFAGFSRRRGWGGGTYFGGSGGFSSWGGGSSSSSSFGGGSFGGGGAGGSW